MTEIPDEQIDRIQGKLAEIVGPAISSFTVKDGVLKVRVTDESAKRAIPYELAGYPTEVSVEQRRSPVTCFHGTGDYSESIRQNQSFDPIPSGVEQWGCTTGTIVDSSRGVAAVTAGHCVWDPFDTSTPWSDVTYHQQTEAARDFTGSENFRGINTASIDFAFGPIATDWSTELLGFDSGVGRPVIPQEGEQVTRLGIMTGITSGEVVDTNVTYTMNLGTDDDEVFCAFKRGIDISNDSIPGDSGGLSFVERNGTYHPIGVTSGSTEKVATIAALVPAYNKWGLNQITGRKKAQKDGTIRNCGGSVPVSEALDGGEESVSIRPE